MVNTKRTWFVYSIPIINALAANTTGYFPDVFLNPGAIRGLILGILLLYFFLNKKKYFKIDVFILIYILYFLVLALLSSDSLFSLDLFSKFAIGVLMFPLGYYYITTETQFKTLMNSFLIALVINIINIAVSNYFKLGTSDYLDKSFYFGAGRVNITKSMLLLVFFAPLTLHLNRKNRVVLTVFFLIGLLISIIGIKRSVLLSGISGLIIYSFFKRNKTRLVKGVLMFTVIMFLFILVFPYYTDTFLSRYLAREERIEITEETLNEEARYNEVFAVTNEWVAGSVKHKLIGSELFNDRIYYKSERMLHTDYMIILNGAGSIGIVLWFLIYWVIIREKNKYYANLKNDELYREMNITFYMLLAAQLIMSIAGTVYSIDIRYIFFLFWGATIGTMKSRYFEIKRQLHFKYIANQELM